MVLWKCGVFRSSDTTTLVEVCGMSPSPLLSAEVWRFPKELGPGIQGLDDREMKL